MPRQLHVAFLSHVARFSGAEIEMLRVIDAADGLRATVLLAEDGPLVEPLREAGAHVEVLRLDERARSLKRTEVRAGAEQARVALHLARYVNELRSRLVRLAPDVVSAVSLKAGVYGAVAARLARLPFVWHLHDQLSADYISRQAVLPMRAIVGTLPNAVIAPSRTSLATVGRFRRGMRVAVVPHPIPIPPRAVTIRPRVERVGIVGRLAPWKGQDVFLRAFAEAFPDSEARAVVIGTATFGEQDFAGELRQAASELGILNRVDFLGFRRDVEAELAQLDLLVHASVLTEPFGMVVFEGMAAGLPVIAAGAGGPAEYIEHGVNGLLHKPGDVPDLASMLSLAANDQGLRARLASAGRDRVSDFAPDKVVQAWLDIYRSILPAARMLPHAAGLAL